MSPSSPNAISEKPGTVVSPEDHQKIDELAVAVIVNLKMLKSQVEDTRRSDIAIYPEQQLVEKFMERSAAGPIIYKGNLQVTAMKAEQHLSEMLKIMMDWLRFDNVHADSTTIVRNTGLFNALMEQHHASLSPEEIADLWAKKEKQTPPALRSSTTSFTPAELGVLFREEADHKSAPVAAQVWIDLAHFREEIIFQPREGPKRPIEDTCWAMAPKIDQHLRAFEEVRAVRASVVEFNKPRIIPASSVAPVGGFSPGEIHRKAPVIPFHRPKGK